MRQLGPNTKTSADKPSSTSHALAFSGLLVRMNSLCNEATISVSALARISFFSVAAPGLLWVPALSSPFVASARFVNEGWQKRLDPASVSRARSSLVSQKLDQSSLAACFFFFLRDVR